MVDWTYTRKYTAWLGDVIVTIPDQIADDQMRHDKAGTVFPALYHNGVAPLFRSAASHAGSTRPCWKKSSRGSTATPQQ